MTMTNQALAAPGAADAARGALLGVALGDAMGMPGELWPREHITERLGWIDHFRPGPSGHFIVDGYRAGQVTDDTQQTLMLASAIVAGKGEVDPVVVARELVAWADRVGASEGNFLGPSSAKAIEALRQGADPLTMPAPGETNGAAMRIAPIGIVRSARNLDALVAAVTASCTMSHRTSVAISGAAFVAGVIAAAIDAAGDADDGDTDDGDTDDRGAGAGSSAGGGAGIGQDAGSEAGPRWDSGSDGGSGASSMRLATARVEAAFAAGLAAAELGRHRGELVHAPSIAVRCQLAADLAARPTSDEKFLQHLYDLFGGTVATADAVPSAAGLFIRGGGDPLRTAILAANLGGDTDTIGAIATSMAGAIGGLSSIPPAIRATLEDVNGIDPVGVADTLLQLRR